MEDGRSRIFIKYRRSKTSKKNDSQYKKKIQNILTRRSRISNKVNLKMVERRKFLLVFSCLFSVNVVKLHATKKECELGKRLIYKSAFSVITRNKENLNPCIFYFFTLYNLTFCIFLHFSFQDCVLYVPLRKLA